MEQIKVTLDLCGKNCSLCLEGITVNVKNQNIKPQEI